MAEEQVTWEQILRGELSLTGDILIGFFTGVLIIQTGLADKLLKKALPHLKRWGIGATIGAALAVSTGSSKAGAAVIASALDSGKISERTARWGTLMLAFPGYIRRWITTMILSCSLAGWAGAFFALTLLFRSAAKFALELFMLNCGEHDDLPLKDTGEASSRASAASFAKRLLKTLPLAWLFYAAAMLLVPLAEKYLQLWLTENPFFSLILSERSALPALAVAAASFAHVSAALALAGGSLAAGELTTAQAVFALLFGNSLSLLTRLVRTNAGYYFGFFPRRVAQSMLCWNICTSAALGALTLFLAALPLLLR